MFKPLHDLILVRPDAEETVTQTGIYIPATAATDKNQTGVVLAVGPGRSMPSGAVVPIDAQVGERVMFGRFAGSEIDSDGEQLLLVHEAEVLAVLG